jgi:hypothetical protein
VLLSVPSTIAYYLRARLGVFQSRAPYGITLRVGAQIISEGTDNDRHSGLLWQGINDGRTQSFMGQASGGAVWGH